MKKYVLVTNWYGGTPPGEVFEFIKNRTTATGSVYVVNRQGDKSNRWISHDCGRIITKEENPELFI